MGKMTLTINTVCMISFNTLTNNAGQNDTYNNCAQHDVIQLIDKQGWAK